MAAQPTGTVTLLFSDIEGSTRLLDRLGRDRYAQALDLNRRLLREAFQRHDGYEVDCEGDSFFMAFSRADDAVAAAAEAQQALAQVEWPEELEFRVRMGIHTGEPLALPPKYVGLDVHRAARVMAAAYGQQVLITQATRDLLDDHFKLRDLGEHRLKDLSQPQRLFQLRIDGVPSDFPPLNTLDNRPTNLPAQPTPLIGRERELAEVAALIGGHTRLLTLTGTGGTGKTRLALQVAADMIEAFPNGVFLVNLAPVSGSDLVVPTIAQTVGVREQAGEPLIQTLSEHLREKRLLLLLDNFEHVLSAAPGIATLLRSAADLAVLCTSRTPLHLSGERIYDVPPLALPDPAHLPDATALSQYDAVALFIERAVAARTGFGVTNANAPAIAQICARLDGLPLALELAAARVRSLPPQTLLARLDERLKLLIGGARDLEERQQTLRGTIDWSYQLLSAAEQRLFACLSVSVGGCTLEAAETVCQTDKEPRIDILDGLDSLVEKSLLRQREVDGEARFSMLETVKEYAGERLDALDEAEGIRRRHADYYLQLSKEAATQLEGGEQQSIWMMRLEQEHNNLRAALRFLARDPESQLDMVLAIEPFWRLRGHWQEGRRWHEQALDATDKANPKRLKALDSAQYFAYLERDFEPARTLSEELLLLAREADNRPMIAMALNGLSLLTMEEGDLDRTKALCEESLEFCKGTHDSVHPLSGLGFVAFFREDYAAARAFFERCFAVERACGDEYEMAVDLASLSTILAFEGDDQEARSLLGRGIALARKLDSRPALVMRCVPAMAALRSLDGDSEASIRLIGAAEALREEMGAAVGAVGREVKRRIVAAAQSELDEIQIAKLFEEGRSLTLDEALADAPGNAPEVLAGPSDTSDFS